MASAVRHPLIGKVALVTGATRGIGKGIALQLCEAGALVYVTGRTLMPKGDGCGGSLHETIEEMKARGAGVGRGEGIQCDHSKDEDIAKLFEKIGSENDGQLDILVNNAYSAVNVIGAQMGVPFYEQPLSTWDAVNNVGLRNHYLCTVMAAKLMVPRGSGLIVNVSSFGGLRYLFNIPYGVGKEACDRMMRDCSVELKKCGVACISLWPGAVRTEQIMYNLDHGKFGGGDGAGGGFGDLKTKDMVKAFQNGESTEFAGKCLVALAADPKLMAKTGRILMTSELACEYGLYDSDGRQPASVRSIKTGLELLGGVFAVIAKVVPTWVKIPYWMLHLGGNKF